MSVPELDPQIIEVLRKAEEAGLEQVETLTPEVSRANYEVVVKEQFGPVDEVFSVEDRDADGVPVRIYRGVETDEPSMALIYFHGGGWVIGSLDTHDGCARAFAKRAGIVVISVGYRLAPEHPYPAALDDAWTAARWVMANAEELKIDAEKVGVGGDSVGGCLAAIVARKGRDVGTPFATQLLIYPTMTSRAETQSYSLYQLGYGLTRDGMEWFWRQYIGDADGTTNPDISPAALQDLRRLPRAIVVTAEADVLRDEAEAYAQRLFLAGVETEGYRYDGMIHGFLRMAGVVDRSNQAIDELCESLKPFLAKGWREDFEATADQ
ncbi:MAG TPA: alpha/beta hydrolase [Gaiellaceae bacterium]|jgi:acetyl esterase